MKAPPEGSDYFFAMSERLQGSAGPRPRGTVLCRSRSGPTLCLLVFLLLVPYGATAAGSESGHVGRSTYHATQGVFTCDAIKGVYTQDASKGSWCGCFGVGRRLGHMACSVYCIPAKGSGGKGCGNSRECQGCGLLFRFRLESSAQKSSYSGVSSTHGPPHRPKALQPRPATPPKSYLKGLSQRSTPPSVLRTRECRTLR